MDGCCRQYCRQHDGCCLAPGTIPAPSLYSPPSQRRLTLGTTSQTPLTAGLWDTVLVLPVRCIHLDLEGWKEVGAIVPQAIMVAADIQALVNMRSCIDWPDPGAVGRCEGSSNFLILEGTTALMANLTAPGGLHPPFSSPVLPSDGFVSTKLPKLNPTWNTQKSLFS